MNPIKLKFHHGGEMLVSPIGLRFVEDPDHGPLVLIPELSGPRAYQLDMTLEEARAAYDEAEDGEALTLLDRHVRSLYKSVVANQDRWGALQIHLGLPEGWEHLREGAAEVKGALVSQAEMLDSIKAHVDALYDELGLNAEWHEGKLRTHRDQASPLTELVLLQKDVSLLKEETSLFTLAERVGELEESRSRHRKRLDILEAESKGTNICLRVLGDQLSLVESENLQNKVAALSDEVRSLKTLQEEIHPTLSETWTDTIAKDWWNSVPAGLRGGASKGRAEKAPQDLDKPKSAWKPLNACTTEGMVLIRSAGGGLVLPARVIVKPWSCRLLTKEGWNPTGYPQNYEFCPIPE